jgi:hypothetical protein
LSRNFEITPYLHLPRSPQVPGLTWLTHPRTVLSLSMWDGFLDCESNISSELIKTECEKWSKFHPVVITYAMWLHIEKHDDKKEEYTLGIMRNTNEFEATQKLREFANKAIMIGGETYDEHTTSTFTDPKPNEPATTGKWDHLVIH